MRGRRHRILADSMGMQMSDRKSPAAACLPSPPLTLQPPRRQRRRRPPRARSAVLPGPSPPASATGKRTAAASISRSLCRLDPYRHTCRCTSCKYTLLSSIFNRITGLVLSVGLVVLIYWLMAVADGARAQARAQALLCTPLLKLFLRSAGDLVLLPPGRRHPPPGLGHRPGSGARTSQKSAWLVGVLSIAAACCSSLTGCGAAGGRHEPAQPAAPGARAGIGQGRRPSLVGAAPDLDRARAAVDLVRGRRCCRCPSLDHVTVIAWMAQSWTALLLDPARAGGDLAFAARRAGGHRGLRTWQRCEDADCWCCRPSRMCSWPPPACSRF